MKSRFILLALGCLISFSTINAANLPSTIGIVNFTTCIMESKYGKQEQEAFETLRKQMATLIEDIEKQLTDLSQKFNDPDYLDSLSPEAEQEMKMQFQSLNEELARYQNQYYQIMNQANMKLVQTMSTYVTEASQKVAKQKDLAVVINKDAVFYFEPKYEVTTLVISEMDRLYEKDNKLSQAETDETNAVATGVK